ncbi:MAG: low-specificity L-threonine aldolase [Legionella sp.]|nr:low-specificity L-threonine aldolase [Legionella sp.]
MKQIDLRSDTVTRPTKGMLKAMMNAEVGDDVYGEDVSVKKLETIIAERAGKEAAIFAPSGTQSNLIALMSHCERGDEYIAGQTAHTYLWEGGGAAVLGSIQPQPLDFEEDGSLCLKKVALAIKIKDDHHARSKLFCLENTTQGKVLPLDYLTTIKPFCDTHELSSHLDGARLFNASVKLNVPLQTLCSHFDSISICLSKGLGAPVGSLLCGSKDFIQKARRWRKMLGGGMRQAGILAAAGIYALEHQVERLQEDHDNAAFLAQELARMDEITIDRRFLHTNIVSLRINDNYQQLKTHMSGQGILFPRQPNKLGFIRLVTHLDVTRNDLIKVIEELKNFFRQKKI